MHHKWESKYNSQECAFNKALRKKSQSSAFSADMPPLRSKYTLPNKLQSKHSSQRNILNKNGGGELITKSKCEFDTSRARFNLISETASKYNVLKDAVKRRDMKRFFCDFDKHFEDSTEQYRHVSVTNLDTFGKRTVYNEYDKVEVKKTTICNPKPSIPMKTNSNCVSRSCGNVVNMLSVRNELYQENYSDTQSNSMPEIGNTSFPSKISLTCEDSFDLLEKRFSEVSLKNINKCHKHIDEDIFVRGKSKTSVALSNIAVLNKNADEFRQPIQFKFKYKPLENEYKKPEAYSKYLTDKQQNVSDEEYHAWLKKHKFIANSDSESKSSENKKCPKYININESELLKNIKSTKRQNNVQNYETIDYLYTLEVDSFCSNISFLCNNLKTEEKIKFSQYVMSIIFIIAILSTLFLE